MLEGLGVRHCPCNTGQLHQAQQMFTMLPVWELRHISEEIGMTSAVDRKVVPQQLCEVLPLMAVAVGQRAIWLLNLAHPDGSACFYSLMQDPLPPELPQLPAADVGGESLPDDVEDASGPVDTNAERPSLGRIRLDDTWTSICPIRGGVN